MKIILKIVKWLFTISLGLFLLLFAYLNYITYSFDTETLPENYGKVSTELFISDNAVQPLVVGLGGAEGGNAWAGPYAEKQRKLLEGNGFALLSIAYFGADGIPSKLDRISIDAVHDAVMEASQDPRINQNCIAVMGVSRGGELALLLGSYYEEYKSVVGIVPGSAVFPSLTEAMTTPGFAHNGESLPFVPAPWSATPALLSGNLRGAFEKMMEDSDAMESAAIKIENINGPVLLMSGTTDEQWPSTEMSEAMIARLKSREFSYVSEHIALQGGHNEHHDNFDKVVEFLKEHFLSQPGCTP